ncbi:MAG: hypothetical protein ABI634_18255 [Acidobacteriota bacterium]
MTTPGVIDEIELNELDTCRSVVRLDDEDGIPVALADLADIRMSLYNGTPDQIINSRDNVSVKNAAGGSMAATSGQFTMVFSSADSPIVTGADVPAVPQGERQTHYAKFTATWGSAKQKSWLIRLRVVSLSHTP